MAFRREALLQSGPFDEELGAGARYGAGEDTDMLYRVMRAGWTVACRDDITVVHHDWRALPDDLHTHYRYGLGAGAQTAKHAADGDRTATRILLREAVRHLGWFVRQVATLRLRAAAAQPAFLAGLVVGFIRRRTRPGR
jgi:GT2 family glycosyltransferase